MSWIDAGDRSVESSKKRKGGWTCLAAAASNWFASLDVYSLERMSVSFHSLSNAAYNMVTASVKHMYAERIRALYTAGKLLIVTMGGSGGSRRVWRE